MKMMNILFVFGLPIQSGGHFRSALAIAKNLVPMGHQVHVASPGGFEEMLREFLSIPTQYFSIPELSKIHRFPSSRGTKKIIEISKQNNIDILHAQDFNAIAPTYLASIMLKKGFVFTKAGGPAFTTAIFPPSTTSTIVYSQELMEGMAKHYGIKRSKLSLIRARIDMSVYKPREISKEFIEKYNLPNFGRKIVMAMRINKAKMPWINNFLQFAEQSNTEQAGIKIILAGDGPSFSELKERVRKINRTSKQDSVVQLTGPILDADEICQLYNYADIVVGHGRGILEAMACKKPVIILGEHGEGELVSEYNVNEIAEFNFSGRHFRLRDRISSDFVDTLKNLLRNEEELQQSCSFSYEYIKTHMDAPVGARQLIEVYKNALHELNSLKHYLSWNLKVIAYFLKMSIKNKIRKWGLRKKAFLI